MKSITKSKTDAPKAAKPQKTSTPRPVAAKPQAQCCAKTSKNVMGCHD
ncbi:MAG: hypothetical protein RBU37_12485 [Myxococcota bacterium]|nr:hypothetical protein [Myxococcota bacterium]